MRVQLLETCGDIPALFTPVNAPHEEVDEPGQAVLVHRLDVGQVGDAEKQDLAGVSDRRVTPANLHYETRERETEREGSRLPFLLGTDFLFLLMGGKRNVCPLNPYNTRGNPVVPLRCSTHLIDILLRFVGDHLLHLDVIGKYLPLSRGERARKLRQGDDEGATNIKKMSVMGVLRHFGSFHGKFLLVVRPGH